MNSLGLLVRQVLLGLAVFITVGLHSAAMAQGVPPPAIAEGAPTASAPPAPDAPPVAQASHGVDAYTMVGMLFSAITTGINGISDNPWARAMGKKIAGSLWILVLSWGIIKNWVMGKGFMNILGDILPPTLMAGLAMFAIDANLGKIISTSIATIASNVAPGASGDGLSIMSHLAQTAMSVFELSSSNQEISIFGGVMIAIGYMAKLAAAIILLGSAAIAAASYVLADVSVAIAAGLGPLLYVWAIWKPTEFLFNGWLKFIITASLQKLIIAFMATLVASVIASVGALAPALRNTTADFVAYAGLMLIAMISAFLMTRAPGIANQLLNGSGGLSLDRWAHAGGGAMTGTSHAAQAANRAGGGVINGAVAGVRGVRGASGSGGSGQEGKSGVAKTVTAHAMSGLGKVATGTAGVVGKMTGLSKQGGGSQTGGMSFPSGTSK